LPKYDPEIGAAAAGEMHESHKLTRARTTEDDQTFFKEKLQYATK